MSHTEHFRLEMRNLSRSISDVDWENEDPIHIGYWREAQRLLGSRVVNFKDEFYKIDIDFSAGIARLEQHLEVMRNLHDTNRTHTLEFDHEPIAISASVECQTKPSWAESILLNWIYDIFLIMNISAPGSFDLFSSDLHPARGSATSIHLSNVIFDAARVNGLEGKPFSPKLVPLHQTIEWFYVVRSGLRQIPQNPSEKCLFALLHLANGDIAAPNAAWIFYALEALLQTSPGQNLNAVRDRASVVLGLKSTDTKRIQKGLRGVYDVRSSFVHGGMRVGHPLQNEQLDRDVDKYISNQLEASDFGCALIILLLQKIIEAGLKFPSFEEVLLTPTVL